MKLAGTPVRPVDPMKSTPGPHQSIGSGLWQPPTLDVWFKEVEKAQRWLIPQFIPADAIVLTSGQKKRAMKTFSAMTTALCLATGTKASMFQPVGDMPVLFLEEEGGRAETRERLMGICRTLKIDPEAKSKPLRHLFFSYHNRAKLDDRRWSEELAKLVKREGIKYVVLDAIVYMHSGDENKVSEMTPVVSAMQGMRYHGATVNFLAHLDKTRGGNKREDVDDQVRGSGVLTDCFDTHLAYRRYKMTDAHIDLTVRHRSGPEKKYTVAWQINSHSEGHGAEEHEIIDLAQLSMIEVLGETDIPKMAKKFCAKLEDSEVYSERDLRQKWGLGTKMCKDVIAHLVEEGSLEEKGSSYIFIAS